MDAKRYQHAQNQGQARQNKYGFPDVPTIRVIGEIALTIQVN